MKSIILLVLFLIASQVYSQEEGQSFCDGVTDGSYLPLDIKKKKIYWGDTYYIETIEGDKEINGKLYKEFKQEWENGDVDLLYLREENRFVYEYRTICNKEFLKMDSKAIGQQWEWTADCSKRNFKIVAFNGALETPYCSYKNLLVIKASYETSTFLFYYQKGYGYVGATLKGKLISCVSPEWNW